jgi:hypothetical protein
LFKCISYFLEIAGPLSQPNSHTGEHGIVAIIFQQIHFKDARTKFTKICARSCNFCDDFESVLAAPFELRDGVVTKRFVSTETESFLSQIRLASDD